MVLDIPGRNEQILVGATWSLGLGRYKLSKVVTLAPRFILKNQLSKTISFREYGFPPAENDKLSPGAKAALQVMRPRENKLITIAYPGLNAQWYVGDPEALSHPLIRWLSPQVGAISDPGSWDNSRPAVPTRRRSVQPTVG